MPDADDPLYPLFVSCAITTGVFVIACATAVVAASLRLVRARREQHPTGDELGGSWGGLAPAWYAGSVVFGIGGIVAGFYLLRAPKTARQGYACVVIGAVHLIALVVLTCAGVLWFVPRYAPGLLGLVR